MKKLKTFAVATIAMASVALMIQAAAQIGDGEDTAKEIRKQAEADSLKASGRDLVSSTGKLDISQYFPSDTIAYDYTIYFSEGDEFLDSISGRLSVADKNFFDSSTAGIRLRQGNDVLSLDESSREIVYYNFNTSANKLLDGDAAKYNYAAIAQLATDTMYRQNIQGEAASGNFSVQFTSVHTDAPLPVIRVEIRDKVVKSCIIISTDLDPQTGGRTELRMTISNLEFGTFNPDRIYAYISSSSGKVSLKKNMEAYKLTIL